MIKHFLKKIILFLIILIVVSGGFAWLLTTNDGLRLGIMFFNKVTNNYLTVAKVEGSFLGPINAKKISFKNNGLAISIDNVHFNWRISHLFTGVIDITEIYADQIKISTQKGGEQGRRDGDFVANKATESVTGEDFRKIMAELKSFSVPHWIKLGNVQLRDISWQQGAATPIKISSFSAQFQVVNHYIDSISIILKEKKSFIALRGSLQDEWKVNWQVHLPNLRDFSPEVQGAVFSSGKIYGKRNAPIIYGSIICNHVKFINIAAQGFNSKFHIDSSDLKNTQLQLAASLLKINNISFEKVAIVANMLLKQSKSHFWECSIDIAPMKIFFTGENNLLPLKLHQGTIKCGLGERGGSISGKLFFTQHEALTFDVALPKLNNFSQLFSNQPISGKLLWQTNNLHFFQAFLPKVENIKGGLQIKYVINGTLEKPNLIGTVNLTNASVAIKDLNIVLKDLQANIDILRNKMSFHITAYSGDGFVKISGVTDFTNTHLLHTQARIVSEKFLLANTSEYNVTVSSALELNIDDDVLKLTGKILIPKAIIKPTRFSNNASLPNEIVYVTPKNKKESDAMNLKLYSSLQLTLGPDVFADIMGLQGKVRGKLQLEDEPKKDTTAVGTLYIRNGNYNIYGQKLTVTKGDLHFLGGDATNPQINLEAVRNFQASASRFAFASADNKLTVGIRAQGLLDNMKIMLFSIPDGLSQADILSYLIIGKSSDQASDASMQLLLKAATSLNFAGVGDIYGLTDTIKDKMGLSEFGLAEEARLNNNQTLSASRLSFSEQSSGDDFVTNTVFVLGKFLTPKIYVGYSVGLLDAVNIFRIKYLLSKSWFVQSESSSIGNGVDLFYTISRD